MPKPINNAAAVLASVGRHLDELQNWGADFEYVRLTEHTSELIFNDGCRVVIRVSNATPINKGSN